MYVVYVVYVSMCVHVLCMFCVCVVYVCLLQHNSKVLPITIVCTLIDNHTACFCVVIRR